MTTIKSILGWLFGIYKYSYALQLLVMVLILIHVVMALTAYVYWLGNLILRMFA